MPTFLRKLTHFDGGASASRVPFTKASKNRNDRRFAESVKPGQKITVDLKAEEPRGTPEHTVFCLISLAGAKEHQDGPRNFSGRVEALNYALGVVVKGRGIAKPMVGGHSVIEAEEVNGIAIAHQKAKKDGPKHAHPH